MHRVMMCRGNVLWNAFLLWIVGILFCARTIQADNEIISSSTGVYVKLMADSGTIIVGSSPDPADDADSLELSFVSLREITEAGEEVGQAAHKFDQFANQGFSFSEVTSDKFEDIACKYMTMTTTLLAESEFKVHVYVFTEQGTFTYNGETTSVKAGTVKFSIEISKWHFCRADRFHLDNVCMDGQFVQNADYLEMKMMVGGGGAANAVPVLTPGAGAHPDEYMYESSHTSFSLSHAVRADGKWVSLPEGSPSMVGVELCFRFPLFETGILYDPLIQYKSGGDHDDDDGGEGGDDANASTGDSDDNSDEDADDDSNSDAADSTSIASSTKHGKNVYVQMKPADGSIHLATSNGDAVADPYAFSIVFDEVSEKDVDGGVVSAADFASGVYTVSPAVDTVYQGIACKFTTLSTSLAHGGNDVKFEAEVYVFSADGIIANGVERQQVYTGQTKVNVRISNWPFSSEGACLDLVMRVMNKENAIEKADRDNDFFIDHSDTYAHGNNNDMSDNMYTLGGQTRVAFSHKIMENGETWSNMTSGYPQLSVTDSAKTFTFRFPAFTESVWYDPIFSLYEVEETYSSAEAGITLVLLGALALVFFIAILVFWAKKKQMQDRAERNTKNMVRLEEMHDEL